MKIEFIKQMSCKELTQAEQKNKMTRGLKCSMSFNDELEKQYPRLERGVNYHTKIDHESGNHKVTLFVYDHNKKHESEHKGKIIIQDSDLIEKYKGQKLEESKIKKCFN